MAVWRFNTPNRILTPLMEDHPLWSRVFNQQGVALVQHSDGSWEEFPDLPGIYDANADYAYGRTDRSSIPRGRGFGVSQDHRGQNLETPEDREFRSPLRIFRGGHVYFISDALKAILEAVVTREEALGYGAYITGPVSETETGDEIQLSGRTIEYEQGRH